MRHFTYNGPNPIKQIASYCKTLETDLNSLINYIDYFTPNYKILNYTPRLLTQYYSNDELIAKNYILPVQIISRKDFIERTFRDDQRNPKGESSLIIFPNYLKLHEGLLNRFPEYDQSRIGVLLYYGTAQELIDNKQLIQDDTVYFLPDTVLSIDVTKPQIQLKARSIVANPFEIQLEYKDKVNPILYSGTQLSVATATEMVSAYGPSLFQRFEPAHIIVSLATAENEKDTETASARLDPANYLVCRFAAAGTYYYNNNFNT
jgi:hypothetical protein